MTRRYRKRHKAAKRRGATPASGRRRGGEQSAAPPPVQPSVQAPRLVYFGVVACFFLSGFAALLYQTAWLRQFSLVFGTSELAVATVLAAYMGGLALGSAVAGRYAGRVTRPVLAYGVLEAGIALSALAVPLLLLAARALYALMLGDQPTPPDAATIGQPVFYLLVAFVVLAIPTAFMGATLPLLIRYAVRTDREVGPRVALLDAINTVGTVVAAFVLLPAFGLIRSFPMTNPPRRCTNTPGASIRDEPGRRARHRAARQAARGAVPVPRHRRAGPLSEPPDCPARSPPHPPGCSFASAVKPIRCAPEHAPTPGHRPALRTPAAGDCPGRGLKRRRRHPAMRHGVGSRVDGRAMNSGSVCARTTPGIIDAM